MSRILTARNDVSRCLEGSSQETQWVGPVEFVVSDRCEAARILASLAQVTSGYHIHLVNAYTVALASKNPDYRRTLGWPALCFPDGKPISWISSLSRHRPKLRQVRGPQLFLDTFDIGRQSGIRHFLLGSTPEVLAALEANLQSQFPGVLIVGTESPPFRALSSDELREQDKRILATRPDIVWVGLGTPKQDLEAQRIARRMPVVAVAVGAAFDFAAGTAREAPRWMSRLGFEWLFRFACEPRRLWRRYTFGNARFLAAAVSWRYLSAKRGHRSLDAP